jgi:hypothetical protein
MALKKLIFKPGVNRDITSYANEGGWYACDKIRFRKGFPEKIGGWTVINFDQYKGDARSLFSYKTTDGEDIISIGTDQKYYVLTGTTVRDVTPVRATFTSTDTDNMFETTSGSTTVTINLTSHGASDGDYVTFSGATAVGGIPAGDLNKEFQCQNVTGNAFDITVATAATSTVAAGGGTSITATFQIAIGYSNLTAGYGWGAGTWSRGSWGSGAATPVLFPERLIFQDQFNNDLIWNIQDGTIYYWQYDSSFSNISVPLSSLTNSRAVPTQVGKTMFTSSGHLLALACSEYYRETTAGVTISGITASGRDATITTTVAHGLEPLDWVEFIGQQPIDYRGEYQVIATPTSTTFTILLNSTPSTSATTVGTYVDIDYTVGAPYDPLLIRWADVSADTGPVPEEWKPEITNTAGFLRVKGGSKIITGFKTRQETLIWTDTSLNSLQFLGTAEVFSLQDISDNINIAGPNVIAEANNVVMWMGHDKFYAYDGRINTLPCTLKQYIFDDINVVQSGIFFAGTNREFDEVIWFYCSAASNTIDRYVIYNYQEQVWYYGSLNRTSWHDSQSIKYPLAASGGYIYKHEDGVDDGQPLGGEPQAIDAYIESADMAMEDGDKFVLTKRVIPDVNFTNSQQSNPVTGDSQTPTATVTVSVRNFPGAALSGTDVEGNTLTRDVITSASIDQYTNQVFIRARGRQMSFKIASDSVGTQWELGAVRIDFRPDGRRG